MTGAWSGSLAMVPSEGMVRWVVSYLVLASIACGPSLAQLHASDASYERCYAADFDPSVAASVREQCWSDWLEHHAEHQPPERISFAQARLRQLENETSARPLPHASPEPIPARDHEYPPAAPGSYRDSGCDPLCRSGWDECNRRCDLDNQLCKTACESEFRICNSGCP